MKLPKKLHLLVLPHPHNNHRAKVLQPLGLFWISLVVLLLPWFINATPQSQVLGYASDITAEDVINLTNQQRLRNQLKPLKPSPELSQAAHDKAQDMFAKDYWAHVSPEGTQPWYFITQSGYQYLYAGENLARDFADSEAAMVAWMASPTHRDNILNIKYDDIGVAVVNGELNGVPTTLIVQEFGKPRHTSLASLPEAASTENQSLGAQDSLPVEDIIPPVSTEQVYALGYTDQPTTSFAYNPLQVSKSWSSAAAILLALVLIIDAIYVARKRIIRMSGKSLAHISFIIMIILAIIGTQPGFIL